MAKITFQAVTDVFPITGVGAGVSPPFRKQLNFAQPLSSTTCPVLLPRHHNPGHQGACTAGVLLALHPSQQHTEHPPCVYKYSSVADEPMPTCLSSLLPPHRDPRSSRESWHPADLARKTLKGVSNTNGSFAPVKT